MFYGNQHGNVLGSFGQTADGGYYFAGYTASSAGSSEQGFIQKTDKKGKIEWYQEYGGKYYENFMAVHQASDGGFIAVGNTSSISLDSPRLNYNNNAYIVKTDSHGNLLWQKAFGDKHNDCFIDASETPDHDIVAVGYTQKISNSPLQSQFYVVKMNQNGDSLWSYSSNNLFYGSCTSVAITPGGNIGVAGYAKKTDTLYSHPVFVYLNAKGELINPIKFFDNIYCSDESVNQFSSSPARCEKILSTTGGFIYTCTGNLQLSPGGYLIGGNFYVHSLFTGKIDYNGNFLWRNEFDGEGGGVEMSDVQLNMDGSFMISGNIVSPYVPGSFSNFSAWILNINATGGKTSELLIPGVQFVEGAVFNNDNYTFGFNRIPSSSNHAYYFGLAITDNNGKVK